MLNCSCTVFCPCVVSLGQHPPTEGHCEGWAGVQIQSGSYGSVNLKGLNIGLLLDIPGNMARGDWKAALYVDERASDEATEALQKIFSGQAKGSTGLFAILISELLGVKKVPISYNRDGARRIFDIPGIIHGEVAPISGKVPGKEVTIENTAYWMGPVVTVSHAIKSKLKDFGRLWNFSGRSAEICQINWSGPGYRYIHRANNDG